MAGAVKWVGELITIRMGGGDSVTQAPFCVPSTIGSPFRDQVEWHGPTALGQFEQAVAGVDDQSQGRRRAVVFLKHRAKKGSNAKC